MENNKYIALVSNTAIFAVGNILIKLIAFFFMPLYTYVLTTEQYGIAELLNSSIEIVVPIATFCIVEALYRFAIDEDANHIKIFTNAVVILLIGDIIVLLCCLLVSNLYEYGYVCDFFFLFIAITFYKLTTQFARGLGQAKRYVVYGILNALLLIFFNIIFLVVLRGGIHAYLASFSIAYFLSGCFAFILSSEYDYFNLKKFDKETLKAMLRYSAPNIPNMLSWWINNVSSRYILLFFWDASVTGLFTAASKLPAIINLGSSIFQQAWQYSTAKEIESEDGAVFFSIVFRTYLYLCICLGSLLIVFNKTICRLLLQADFYIAFKYVPFLLLAAIFGCISIYFGTFYQAMKDNMMLMTSTMIGAVVNVILNFILIPWYEGLGAAIATVISYIIVVIIRVYDIEKKIPIKIDWFKAMVQIGCLIILAISSSLAFSAEFYPNYLINCILVIIILFSDLKIINLGYKKIILLVKKWHRQSYF